MNLSVKQLIKKFGPSFSLGPINCELSAGSTAALFGHNGAGKTTLFQLITGNMESDGGEIQFLEQKLAPDKFLLKREIGYLPQDMQLPPWLSPSDILNYVSSLHQLANGVETVASTLAFWDCLPFSRRAIKLCSYGMQKRVGLALATIHDPPLLVLDEPFSGLDLSHVKALLEHIKKRSETGKITIVSTHNPSFAARLCNEAFILEAGRLKPIERWSTQAYFDRTTLIDQHFL